MTKLDDEIRDTYLLVSGERDHLLDVAKAPEAREQVFLDYDAARDAYWASVNAQLTLTEPTVAAATERLGRLRSDLSNDIRSLDKTASILEKVSNIVGLMTKLVLLAKT